MTVDGVVIVEFYGVPRQRAGRAELPVAPGAVADVLSRVQHDCPGLDRLITPDGRLAPHFLLSLDGREFLSDLSRFLQAGDRLLILSADAGG